MSPDIYQILTHIIGFLVVVWLMKKFAWKPLLNMMDERRQKIVDEFQKIDDDRAEVEQIKSDYEGKLKNIDAERRQKITEAVNEGNKIASDIKLKAQEQARDIINRTNEQLERDVAKAKVQLKEEMVTITLTAAEKILREKLDEKKERELIGKFIDNIEKA
ncbi:MAG: ATP synthase F0 subunit B [Candidatus Zixiibacteriota bacterium]|nr:MAG: ATP synthase F0 subunit B [candidate division Zixibacteria bacterium]HDL04499.1 ATP synthase F0 subunit B [candidate division Zixibacteria bacterium]